MYAAKQVDVLDKGKYERTEPDSKSSIELMDTIRRGVTHLLFKDGAGKACF